MTLGSQEGEGAVAVAMDRFGRFFDFVQAIEAEESECEVAQCCHGVWSVSDPGLVVVLSPGGVSNVVAFVLDSPVLAYVGVQVGRAGVTARASEANAWARSLRTVSEAGYIR